MKKLSFQLTKYAAYIFAILLVITSCTSDEDLLPQDGDGEVVDAEYVTVFNEVPDDATSSSLEATLIALYGEAYTVSVQKIKVTGEIGTYDFAVLNDFTAIDLSEVTIVGSIAVNDSKGSEATLGDHPNSISTGQAIKSYAFAIEATESATLREVILPNNLAAIGKSAFYGNNKLESVTFVAPPVSEDGDAAVESSAKSRAGESVVDSPLMVIYPGAFQDCSMLTEFDFVAANTYEILENAFDGCSAFTEVDIPYGVITLGNQAFRDCTALERVDIGATVGLSDGYVGTSVFKDCSSLREVTVNWTGTNIPQIDMTTFADQFRTNSRTYAIAVPDPDDDVASYVTNYQAIDGWDYFGLVHYADKDQDIADIYAGLEFTISSSSEDNSDSSLQSSTLYDSMVEYYGEDFMTASEPFDFLIVTGTITANDFQYMQNFKTVDLYGVSTIDFYVDEANGVSMDNAIIPESAFENNDKMVTFVAPYNLIHAVKAKAFKNCTELVYYEVQSKNSTVNNNNRATSFGAEAFMGCSKLVGNSGTNTKTANTNQGLIFLHNNLSVTIGDDAFSGCKSLTTVTFKDAEGSTSNQFYGVSSIGARAFQECENITSLTLPRGLTTIGSEAFDECDALTSITTSWTTSDMDFIEIPNLTGDEFPEDFKYNQSGGVALATATHTITVPTGTEKIFNGVPGWRNYAMKNDSAGATDYDTNTIYIPNEVSGYNKVSFTDALSSIKAANLIYNGTVSTLDELVIEGYMTVSDLSAIKSTKAASTWKTIDLSTTTMATVIADAFNVNYDAVATDSAIETIKLPSTITTLEAGAFDNCDNLKAIHFGWTSTTNLDKATSTILDLSSYIPEQFKSGGAGHTTQSVYVDPVNIYNRVFPSGKSVSTTYDKWAGYVVNDVAIVASTN